ncbi:MAG: hypothetical protein MPW14_23795 [Candidatus Manganitrophus sp.]|nr:MAG: hypothetical protein MPW14_23795 [Candidatus Manganitrophus sp.]
MPAPSPVQGSQPTAPRWSRFSSDLQPIVNDVVGTAALDVGQEADAAGIVLELRDRKGLVLRGSRVDSLTRRLSSWDRTPKKGLHLQKRCEV